MRRIGIIVLVMGLVLSLAGLASADDEVADTTGTTIAPGSTSFPLYENPDADPLVQLVEFVVFWGGGGDGFSCTPVDATDTEPAADCLDITGPNGQVNHGTFMSAFVHWLKTSDALNAYDGPRGRLVRQAAKSGIGKKDNGASEELETPDIKVPDDQLAGEQPHGHSNSHNPHS
jgi:hypothetical protein